MGKIRNLCMTQLVRMKKIKEPDMYTWIFLLWTTVIIIIIPGICLSM